jgi:hypothetical protein
MQQETDVVLGFECSMKIFPLIIDTTVGSPTEGLFTGYGTGRFFGFRAGTLSSNADKHECGDSLSGINKRWKAGRTSLEMTAEFYEKWDLDVHEAMPAGFGLKNGAIVGVAVYTQGFDDIAGLMFDPWWLPNFTIFDVKYSFDEEGKVNGSWDGAADNAWYRPGEVIPPDQLPPVDLNSPT